MNKKDKDNLIILFTLVVLVVFTFLSYKTTRLIPLKYITAAYIIATAICWGKITQGYLKLYGINASWTVWIPILNCINTFPVGLAIALIVDVITVVLSQLVQFIPADILYKLLGQYNSLGFYDMMQRLCILGLIAFMILVGVGYCSIYKDVRDQLRDATGLRRPKSEFVTYVFLFIPLIATMGYSTIITELNQLNRMGVSAFEKEDDTEYKERL